MRYQGAEGPGELRAELTVACDGRWSIARHEAGLKAREFPVNFDVWWFKLPREGDAEFSFLPRFSPGKGLGVIPREGYFQIAYPGPREPTLSCASEVSRNSVGTSANCCPKRRHRWRR